MRCEEGKGCEDCVETLATARRERVFSPDACKLDSKKSAADSGNWFVMVQIHIGVVIFLQQLSEVLI